MGYKKIKPKLIHLDDLVRVCGLFNGESNKNNGYGCISRSKRKDNPGECHYFDCPIAVTASLKELKDFDRDLYEQYLPNFKKELKKGESEEHLFPHQVGSDWMVQYFRLVSVKSHKK